MLPAVDADHALSDLDAMGINSYDLFPDLSGLAAEHAALRLEWGFRGGADEEIAARFAPLVDRAARGDLDDWAEAARSRLSLIIVLDQFSRTVFRGAPRA